MGDGFPKGAVGDQMRTDYESLPWWRKITYCWGAPSLWEKHRNRVEKDQLRTALEAANQARVEAEARLQDVGDELGAHQRYADRLSSKLAEAEKERDEALSVVLHTDLVERELKAAQALLTKYERAIREHFEWCVAEGRYPNKHDRALHAAVGLDAARSFLPPETEAHGVARDDPKTSTPSYEQPRNDPDRTGPGQTEGHGGESGVRGASQQPSVRAQDTEGG